MQHLAQFAKKMLEISTVMRLKMCKMKKKSSSDFLPIHILNLLMEVPELFPG